MSNRDVKTPEQALAYMTECTLATVVDMALANSRPKDQFQRQISIAQKGIFWMGQMNIDMSSRAERVMKEAGGSVALWAEFIMYGKNA